jgi:8-oxo-dGTP pyrophosphatase MutT (NUDIX family)
VSPAGPHSIHRVRAVRARLAPFDWAFARERRAAIDAHWATLVAGKPAMFNGRVLMQTQGRLAGDVFEAAYGEVDYASFLAWRDFGYPPAGGVRNGFAMAALRAADGAFLLGEMGPHTANAGKVYFASGTPDPGDVRPDGTVDLAGSVLRELAEETGLLPDEISVADAWTVLLNPVRAAFMRPVTLGMPADEARRLMLSRIATQSRPELSGIVVVRSPADLTPAMPAFMHEYLLDAFAG